jgi:hypothetical protein
MSRSIHPAGMRTFVRVMMICVLLACIGFCTFGFVATFEPMKTFDRTVWRTVYGLVGTAFVLGAVRMVRCQLLCWSRDFRTR